MPEQEDQECDHEELSMTIRLRYRLALTREEDGRYSEDIDFIETNYQNAIPKSAMLTCAFCSEEVPYSSVKSY